MSTLLDAFAAAFDRPDGPAGAHDGPRRRAVLQDALRDGLPGARSEAWKYTPLRALERRAFTPATAAVPDAALSAGLDAALAAIPAPRLVFVDGHADPARSDVAGLPAGVHAAPLSRARPGDDAAPATPLEGADAVFARLNAALAEDGAVIHVDAGVAGATLHLAFIATGAVAEGAAHLRHAIELRDGAALHLVEHHLALAEHRGLGNHVAGIRIGARARLAHVRVQAEAAGASAFMRCDAVLAEDADYRRTDLELGAALSRHELNVRLAGPRATLTANGVLFADGKRHLDTRLGIEHIARDTACDLLWRGLAAGRARAVFHGGIVIHAGADGSNANLSNKNLLLSAQAEIDTQPVLVIHADEVQAAHGATVGQLDPTALFYLRSRGLPEAEARALLTAAFCREVLAGIDDAPLRASLGAVLDAHLARAMPA